MNSKKAFTLVELLVVIGIIMLLAVVATVALVGPSKGPLREKARGIIRKVEMGLSSYHAEFQDYPPSVAGYRSDVLYNALGVELILRDPATGAERRRVGPFSPFTPGELTPTNEIKGPPEYVLRYNRPGGTSASRSYDPWSSTSDKDNSLYVDLWFEPVPSKPRADIEGDFGRTGPPTNWRE